MTDSVQEFARLHGVEWDGHKAGSARRDRRYIPEAESLEWDFLEDEVDGYEEGLDFLSTMRFADRIVTGLMRSREGPHLEGFNRCFRDSRETDYGLQYEEMRMTIKPRADYIKVRTLSTTFVEGLEYAQPFKNNLSAILHGTHETLLVTASSSLVVLYRFSPLTHLPTLVPTLVFNVKPDFVDAQDRVAATWTDFPYTINYVAVTTNFAGNQVLGVCTDNGKVHLWKAETIFATKGPGNKNLRVCPDFTLETGALVWGLTFHCCGGRDIVVVSDNSKRVTVYCYCEVSGTFSKVTSNQVAHNLPSVTVIDCVFSSHNERIIKIACASIAGLTYTFETILNTESGQMTALRLLDYVAMRNECWTVNTIDALFLHQCTSLASVFGDLVIDGEMHARRILHELRVLGQTVNQHASSSLGGASRWQFFECVGQRKLQGATIDADEWVRRIAANYRKTSGAAKKLLVVSETKLASLLDANTMHCYSKMERVFDFAPSFDETIKFIDRLSLSCVIPRLLAVILASHRGKVLVMRICTYRGIIGMRQETILEDPEDVDVGEFPPVIIGLTVRNLSCGPAIRYMLYVVYSDGRVIGHELSRNLEQEMFAMPASKSYF